MPDDHARPGISLWKVLLPIALVTAGAAAAAYWMLHLPRYGPGGSPGKKGSHRSVGEQVPDFVLERFGDSAKVKSSELGASIVLVNFWASWCEACVVEMPSMVRLREKFHPRGLEIAFIDVDENPEEVVPKVLEMLEIGFPVFVDRNAALSELFDVYGIPKTVILDRNRKILFIHDGDKDWDAPDLHSRIDQWLSPSS